MSGLPGQRQRTMAPTTVAREADFAALERANVALRAGAHGLAEEALDILGGGMVGWAPIGASALQAAAAGDGVTFDLRRWAGDAIAAIDMWLWQQTIGAPIAAYLEQHRAASTDERTVELVASDASAIATRQYRRRSLGLVDVNADRPAGWRIPSVPGEVPALRVVAGDAGDLVVGITLWFTRPPQ